MHLNLAKWLLAPVRGQGSTRRATQHFTNRLIFAAAWLWWGDRRLGAVVGGSMMIVILMSTSLGAFVPLTLERLRIDPALATGPFVTTSNDILGILIYLSLASWILG